MSSAAPRTRTQRTVLVAGAAGFIGSHVCEALVARGDHVIGIDDLSTGTVAHLAALRGQRRFRFLHHDITTALPGEAFEASDVINLACPASPVYYQRHPVQTVLTSSVGTWRLLELAQRRNAPLLLASTSEVYGDPQVHPQPEHYWGHVNPIGFRSCYDEGKRCAEAMCFAYARERGVAVRVARLFNCFGPRLRPGDGRVVSNFVVQALRGEALTVYGDGRQTRSFCYIDDTVRALLRLLDTEVDAPVNIGNPQEHTVLELAQRVAALTGAELETVRRPLPPDDPVRRCPDISRARQVLAWQPRIDLDEGLRRTISHFRALLATTATATEPL